jgi:ribosomal protein S18 acetylase RimI-like enzyme
MKIKWLRKVTEVDSVTDLFMRNAGQSYISHGDIQYHRSVDGSTWAKHLSWVLGCNFMHAVPKDGELGDIRIALATEGRSIVGFIFVEIRRDLPEYFGTIHDAIIEDKHRGRGIGKALVDFVEAYFRKENIDVVYLESGKGNHSAHGFFKKAGFKQTSIVMRKTL